MGFRFKDFFYLTIILLLGMILWSGSSRKNTQEEDWAWAETGYDVQSEDYNNGDERDLIIINDSDNINDDDGFRNTDDLESENSFHNPDMPAYGQNPYEQIQSPHLPLEEDIVHGEHHLSDTEEDNIVLSPVKESEYQIHYPDSFNLLNDQQDLNSPSNQIEEYPDFKPSIQLPSLAGQSLPIGANIPDSNAPKPELIDAARQILLNHADKAKELGLINPVKPESEEPVTAETESSIQSVPSIHTEGMPKPRIVLRSPAPEDATFESDVKPKIPRIIHQSWESNEIPLNFGKWVKSWLIRNPGWEYWFWTPADIKVLVETNYPKFMDTFESGKMSLEDRANIMRYFIIHAHGGVYAELDMECLNSIDTWIFSHGCFLAEEAREHSYLVNNKLKGNVINALMACRPHHPFYEVILHALPDYLTRYPDDPKRASGSFFLDDIYRAFKKHPLPPSLAQYGDVAMIEPDYFIPSYDERHWSAIDRACSSNIADMPFHVSWLCTLWIRKRMHENQPYKHSYTDHHWVEVSIADIGAGNIATIPVTTVIQEAISGKSETPKPSQTLNIDSLLEDNRDGARTPDEDKQDWLSSLALPSKNTDSQQNLPSQNILSSNFPQFKQESVNIQPLPVARPIQEKVYPQFPVDTQAVNAPYQSFQNYQDRAGQDSVASNIFGQPSQQRSGSV